MLHSRHRNMLGNHLLVLFMIIAYAETAIFNRYQPTHGQALSSSESNIKVEKLASYGVTPEMQRTAVALIQRHYHPYWIMTGIDSHLIGEGMERKFGGIYMVGMFSADFDMAYTIVRRSPSYFLFRVADRMILIAKESSNPQLHNDLLL